MGQKDLDDFFSSQAEEDSEKVQKMIKNTPVDQARTPVLPGKYVMEVGTFAWADKKTKEMRTSPEITLSRNNALLLNISFQVADEGTEVVNKGSSLFHTITLTPAKGADDKKLADTLRFMKPQLSAILGHEDIKIEKNWLKENCESEFTDNGSGKFKLVRQHKMNQRVLVTVDEVLNKLTNKSNIGVVKIEKLRPGDKSITYKYEPKESAGASEKQPVNDVPADVDISPSEEAPRKSSAKHDTSKITGATTEEDF